MPFRITVYYTLSLWQVFCSFPSAATSRQTSGNAGGLSRRSGSHAGIVAPVAKTSGVTGGACLDTGTARMIAFGVKSIMENDLRCTFKGNR